MHTHTEAAPRCRLSIGSGFLFFLVLGGAEQCNGGNVWGNRIAVSGLSDFRSANRRRLFVVNRLGRSVFTDTVWVEVYEHVFPISQCFNKYSIVSLYIFVVIYWIYIDLILKTKNLTILLFIKLLKLNHKIKNIRMNKSNIYIDKIHNVLLYI